MYNLSPSMACVWSFTSCYAIRFYTLCPFTRLSLPLAFPFCPFFEALFSFVRNASPLLPAWPSQLTGPVQDSAVPSARRLVLQPSNPDISTGLSLVSLVQGLDALP